MNPFIDSQQLRNALRRPSAWVLVLVNLSLIAGVLAWDWSVFDIVFLYWVENLIIGAINVLRMAWSQPDPAAQSGSSKRLRQWQALQQRLAATGQVFPYRAIKLFLIPFFIIHYGGFCYGHGVFVLSLFGEAGGGASPFRLGTYLTPTLTLAVFLLGASHLYSFASNFMRGGEYRRSNPMELMTRPYGRIVALHITIILGALLTEISGSPLGLLIVLVIMKTAADLALHEVERKNLSPSE